ncbi:MAG: hypothetical protein OEZ65_08960 [Gemmatimonadota bacterium]|nr:hypothetical protein [Gemmatimonadota bacterium]MDH5759704.1 hypothetical protein [Gemmatimonadota bacterium]
MTPYARELRDVVGSVRDHLQSRIVQGFVVWSAALVGVVLLAGWLLAGPAGWRQGSRIPLFLDAVLLVTLAVGWVLLRALSARWLSEASLARGMDDVSRLPEGSVRGALELGRSCPEGVSEELVGLGTRRVLSRMDLDPAVLSGHLGDAVAFWRRRGVGMLAAVGVVLVLLGVADPGRSRGAWVGLATPVAVAREPEYLPVGVTPGSVEVVRGTDVVVGIEAAGRMEASVDWQVAGDVARTVSVPLVDGRGSWTFPQVSALVEYRVRTPEGATSPSYRITPVDPLFVSDLLVEVVYPPHTGMAPEEYRGDLPALRLPAGSRLHIEGRASRRLSVAEITTASGGGGISLARDGERFEGTWTPGRSGRFDWRFLDEDGGVAEIQPPPVDVLVVPDSAPAISIPVPGRDTILPVSLKQPLILESHDDYGLSRLELVAYRVTVFGERHEPTVQGLDLAGTRGALVRPLLDVSGWELLPGDTVRYFARAVDNSPARQETFTREFVLRMPGAAELRRGAEEELDAMAERLQELAAQAAEQVDETRDLQREAQGEEAQRKSGDGSEAMDFEQREELKRALEEQKALTSDVDSMRAELEALERTMEDAGQADPGLSEDLEELRQLLEQISSDELRDKMDEIAEGLDDQQLRNAEQSLEELAKEQENFRDRLEESLESFRRAAVEQDFRATQSEMEELSQQERALADAMREADDPEKRARQQEDLQSRAEGMEERMERLEERLEKLGEERAAEAVREASQEAGSAREKMEESRRQAEQGESADAGEQADAAAEALEEAARKMQEAQENMASQQAQAVQDALGQAADDALSLARRQSELADEMRQATQDRLNDMRADEASLVQGIRNMADDLQVRGQGAMDQNRELAVQMGRAMESIQRTLASLENRRSGAPSPQAQAEAAVDDLNQVAMMAMAAAQQMGQQEGQQSASGEEMSEQLEQMAQEQGELVNQTGQLMPLQLGQEALAEQLRQLAEQQQSVADELDEASREPGGEDESLGDLEAMAREAQALAQQLAQGRLSPDMIRRQERLFHRLLDAGRSLEREEETDERESEGATAFEREGVAALSDTDMGLLRYRLPDAARLQALPPAVRQLVLEYFERLNRGGREPGGER